MTMGDRIVVMNGGVMQQVGTPEEIYNEPANRYVAGFIGTPPMNFIPGRLEKTEKGFAFSNNMIHLEIPAEKMTPGLMRYEGRDLVGGIRPEYMSVQPASDGERPANHFTATLELSELVGADRYLHLIYDPLDALVPPVVVRGSVHDRFDVGTKLWVTADMNMFLFFDNNTSERIV